MAEQQNVEFEIAPHGPFVPVKQAGALIVVGLSISAFLHGVALFALLQLKPAQTTDNGAQEIPVEIVREARDSPAPVDVEPPNEAQALPAEMNPPPLATNTTAESQAPPDIPSAESQLPPTTQTNPLEPEPPAPSPNVKPPQPAEAAAEPEPPPEPANLAPSSQELAAGLPSAAPTAAKPPPIGHAAEADERQQNELRRRKREEAETARREKAEERKEIEAKKRAKPRAAVQAATRQQETASEHIAPASAPRHPAPTSGADLVDYHSAVLRHLTAFRHYPDSARARGAHGQTTVTFTLDDAGRVVSARILRSSGQADIDAETLAMVRRAQPFPPPPPAAQRSFSASIEFHLD